MDNWKDDFIKFVNKMSKKKGWRCDEMNPYFYQIDLLPYSNAKTLREYKQQQKQKASK
tara:strand:+ start:263 stop:436 length:174 start_codon:yes stop_codon:yes gene_type:complete